MSEIITGKSLGLTSVKGWFMTSKEIALFLRVSERLVQKQMNNGTFPIPWYFLSPHHRVVNSEDFNDYLRKIRVEAGTAFLPTRAIKKIQKEEVFA